MNTIFDNETNVLAEAIVRTNSKASFLDANNIVWKVIADEWVGKRCVLTFDNRACWLENTAIENIKSWCCGEDADYLETFYRNN
jgi:hypothetical protein